MGAFLFYLLKSAFCLILFYVFYRALLSRSTFFRFNRLTLLTGILVCAILPLMEFTASEGNLLHTPFQTMHKVLVEEEYRNISSESNKEEADAFPGTLVDDASSQPVSIWPLGQLIVAIGILYLAGGIGVLLVFSLSTFRMFRLIHSSKKVKYKQYTLALTSLPIGSFSWGRTIVLSEADYDHSKEVLLHEEMHLRSRHTVDLVCMQLFLIVFWFNPAIWLLKRELQELHEYEADNGVINGGIDATRYQLLLVKKAVGTRLYSMANSFNHSKLKKRITMMLKERTNGWARVKLLLFVPVLAGTLYAFAQPEVKENFVQTASDDVQQTTPMDYRTLSKYLKSEEEAYNQRMFGTGKEIIVRERQVHPLLMNAENKLLFNGDYVTKETLKNEVKKSLLDRQREDEKKYGRKDAQIVWFKCDRGTNAEEARQVLQTAYDAFTEIRDSIATVMGNTGKEFLDKEFPILVSQDEDMKQYGVVTGDVLQGIEVRLMNDGQVVKEMKNPPVAELQQAVAELRKEREKDAPFVVSLKVDRDCKMGTVDKVKRILKEVW